MPCREQILRAACIRVRQRIGITESNNNITVTESEQEKSDPKAALSMGETKNYFLAFEVFASCPAGSYFFIIVGTNGY